MTPVKDTQLLKHKNSHETMEFMDLWGDLSSHCDWTVVMVMLKNVTCCGGFYDTHCLAILQINGSGDFTLDSHQPINLQDRETVCVENTSTAGDVFKHHH